jgi:DnaK suppressor protein
MARKKTAEAAAGADSHRDPTSAGRTASTSAGGPASVGADTVAPRARGHRSLVPKRDLQAYRRRLEAELAELRGQRADLEEAAEASLSDATGEVGFDEEFADAGSFTFERERDLSLVDNAKDLIEKVEDALARMDSGRFGRCEACGGTIEAERLDALPYATLCLADARQRARRR